MLFNQHITDLIFLIKDTGARHVVICPGSRNAPLIQGFYRDPHFICHSMADERSAGYLALGMARELNEPVVVLTTSGTAALNLAPSVAEAFHQRIPLFVLTADRPQEWPPQLNNQTIDQQEIFIRNSRAFYNIPYEVPDLRALQKINDEVAGILTLLNNEDPGPVHINVQLKEPLYQELPLQFSAMVPQDSMHPNLGDTGKDILKLVHDRISQNLRDGKKVLILAGMDNYQPEEKSLLNSLAFYCQAVIIAENISNLSSDFFIDCPEVLLGSLSEAERKFLAPDLIISFGGQIVSKRVKIFLREMKDIPLISLASFPADTLKEIAIGNQPTEENRYLKLWKSAHSVARERALRYLLDAPFGNLTAVGKILQSLPPGTIVHLGNSGTVRYAQLFPRGEGLTFYSNRGTSGIDGCLSSAAGAAMVSDALHVVILGDLSFVYDSNGMWNRKFPVNLRIIVLNDWGGGIFRIIEGPDKMPFFEDYSVAHHPVSLKLLTEAYGIKHFRAEGYNELQHSLEIILNKDSGPSVLEVDTHKSQNSSIFKKFYSSIKN